MLSFSFHTSLTDEIRSNFFKIFPRQDSLSTASTFPLSRIVSSHSPDDLIGVYIPTEIIPAALGFP